MTKTRKIEILYRKAKGETLTGVTAAEISAIRKYKVDFKEPAYLVKKANISAYITAVDNGCRTSFYDWCLNNNKADRRYRGSSEKDMQFSNKLNSSYAAIVFGFITWSIALYWILQGAVSIGPCILFGCIIAYLLYTFSRKAAPFTLFFLPIIIAVLAQLYL